MRHHHHVAAHRERPAVVRRLGAGAVAEAAAVDPEQHRPPRAVERRRVHVEVEAILALGDRRLERRHRRASPAARCCRTRARRERRTTARPAAARMNLSCRPAASRRARRGTPVPVARQAAQLAVHDLDPRNLLLLHRHTLPVRPTTRSNPDAHQLLR